LAKIVFICMKDKKQNPFCYKDLWNLSKRLIPDNISPSPPKLIKKDGIFIGILNPSESLPIKKTSICMGHLINPDNNWWQPMAKVPDGSYALFRSNKNYIEILSDIVASRTIWYIQTNNIFIASTSQRAIIFFLKNFKPNKAVYLWMLASGNLGPGLSWDKNIQCLGGNSRLLLNRLTWKLTIKKGRAIFKSTNLSEKEYEIQLRTVLEDVFKHIKLDYSRWILLLSGGFDSRCILLMLRNKKNLKCITWGIKSALNDKYNDAYIAKLLAQYYRLEHEFIETKLPDEDIEIIFNRFLVAGEGRIDQLSAYIDGFEIWKKIYEQGYYGVIRADETFGCPAESPYEVYRNMDFTLHSYYENFPPINENLSEHKQTIPTFLEKRKDESFAVWRDRINAEFEIPTCIAALNDLKLPYVEIINPLLSRKIVQQVRKMPDYLRTKKRLFRKVVQKMSPKIRFAENVAIAKQRNILRLKKIVNFIYDELNTNYAKTLLSDEFLQYIFKYIEISDSVFNKKPFKSKMKYFIPLSLRNILRNSIKKQTTNTEKLLIDYNILAFRAYIICSMNRILSSDANALKHAIKH